MIPPLATRHHFLHRGQWRRQSSPTLQVLHQAQSTEASWRCSILPAQGVALYAAPPVKYKAEKVSERERDRQTDREIESVRKRERARERERENNQSSCIIYCNTGG